MNLYWRITKIALLGIVIPAGVFAFGYFWMGPNMSRLPRLDQKDWKTEIARSMPEKPTPRPVRTAKTVANKPTIKVVSSKADHRRRQRPSFEVIAPGTLDGKPAGATAEVTPPDGTLTSN
jgi:hypothetical protein